MTFEDTEILVANITQGRLWKSGTIDFRAEDNSEIIIDNIEARAEFRTSAGALLASMATAGGGAADGTIEVVAIDDYTAGLVLRLPSAVTEDLEPAINSAGAYMQAGIGDLKVWSSDYEDEEPIDGGQFIVRIYPEVTE